MSQQNAPGTSSAGGLAIRPVDPFDDDDLARWFEVYDIAVRDHAGPNANGWTLPERRVELQDVGSRRKLRRAWVGEVDGEAVASGHLACRLVDNLDSAGLDVNVLPAHQRRGHGTRMLALLEQEAASLGRSILDGEVTWPHGAGNDGLGLPGAEFARVHGYALALTDVQRDLATPVDDALLDRLAAEAAPHHADYVLRTWVGPVPDDLAPSWKALSATLMTEAPTGERAVEVENTDVADLRESEAAMARQGRTRYHAVALDAAGDVVAYTDMVTTVHEPDRAYQWGTLVRRDHRGHRLGMAVKVANHRQLQQRQPEIRLVRTFNAEVNDHMIGVNEQLGFVPSLRLGEFQKRL